MNPTIKLEPTEAETFGDLAREGGIYLVSYDTQCGTEPCFITCITRLGFGVTVRSLDWERPHKDKSSKPHRVHGRVVIETPARYEIGPNRFEEFMSYTIVEKDGGTYHSAYGTRKARDETLAMLNTKQNIQ